MSNKALSPAQELVYYATLGLWAAQQAAEGKLNVPHVVGNTENFCVSLVCGCIDKTRAIGHVQLENTIMTTVGGI